MNLAETLQLLDKLNSVGAQHFKSADFEVNLSLLTTPVVGMERKQAASAPVPQQQVAENTRKAEALIDLLKRKDEEILNTIFPEGA